MKLSSYVPPLSTRIPLKQKQKIRHFELLRKFQKNRCFENKYKNVIVEITITTKKCICNKRKNIYMSQGL